LLLNWTDAEGKPADILNDSFSDTDKFNGPGEWMYVIPLTIAIQHDDMPLFQMLLARSDFDPNIFAKMRYGGWSTLPVFVEAINHKRLEMVRLLLQHPLFYMNMAIAAHPYSEKYFVLPQIIWGLHAAVREGNMEVVELILSLNNVDVSLQEPNRDTYPVKLSGNNVLHVACAESTKEMVEYLLSFDTIRGLVNIRNSMGDVPLYLCTNGETRQMLCNADEYNVKNATDSNKMMSFQRDGNKDKDKVNLVTLMFEIKTLILEYLSPDEKVDLMCMCCKGQDLYLLCNFAMYDPQMVNLQDSRGSAVIHKLSAYSNQNDMLKMLLSGKVTDVGLVGARIQYHRYGETVLRNALKNRNVELVRYLSTSHKDTFKDIVNTSLLLKMVCCDEDLTLMEILLTEFADTIDVNQSCNEWKGPLYEIIVNGRVENLKLLLTMRDDVNPFKTPRDDRSSGPMFLYIIADGEIKEMVKAYIIKHHPEKADRYF
jgi:ankyrin repeat protein